ncbi:MAG TPA: RidA family protein [Fimbriimonadaceae bacterium]|nr:RidA family protein [Fimbriimonadaceae bacterium]
MIRQNISGHSPYEATTGFSRAVRIGNHIFVAGTAPIAPDGGTAHPNDPYQQTLTCLRIIRDAVERAGGSIQSVVRTVMYITDRSHADEVARAHGDVFREIRPAATMVVVASLLRDDWTVEIEADAVVSD